MSKKLLALGMILGLAACGGEEEELEFEDDLDVETAPATQAPNTMPMDTMMMDTMMMDTMGMDTMGM